MRLKKWDARRDVYLIASLGRALKQFLRDPLHESSGKCALWIGMGCKAQNAAIAVAIASVCNAADRRNRKGHGAVIRAEGS